LPSSTIFVFPKYQFSQWDQIFKDPLTTAAIDRVVHHSVIVEFGKEITSHRAQEAALRIQDQLPEIWFLPEEFLSHGGE